MDGLKAVPFGEESRLRKIAGFEEKAALSG
jgi:hypothetical protein